MTIRNDYSDWAEFRTLFGFALRTDRVAMLTPPDANSKLAKNGLPTFGLSLSPHTEAREVIKSLGPVMGPDMVAYMLERVRNVCPWSTPECRKHCVAGAGNGRYRSVTIARAARTAFSWMFPDRFERIVAHELQTGVRRHGAISARLNVFSDRDWSEVAPSWFAIEGVEFYDYTKDWNRTPSYNYHLTYSATERHTVAQIADKVAQGHNVAVVIKANKAALKSVDEWRGMPAVSGDLSDHRPSDPVGVVVTLSAKHTIGPSPMAFQL